MLTTWLFVMWLACGFVAAWFVLVAGLPALARAVRRSRRVQ
ncbi:MAG: hypothetical protein ACRCZP_14535 [Phycicoccus sp.]